MIAFFRHFSRAAAIAPLVVGLASAASAQNYPSRNITLILPFAAGSGTDTTTRLIGKEVGTALGTSMVIENKAGANGSIAASWRPASYRLENLLHLATTSTEQSLGIADLSRQLAADRVA